MLHFDYSISSSWKRKRINGVWDSPHHYLPAFFACVWNGDECKEVSKEANCSNGDAPDPCECWELEGDVFLKALVLWTSPRLATNRFCLSLFMGKTISDLPGDVIKAFHWQWYLREGGHTWPSLASTGGLLPDVSKNKVRIRCGFAWIKKKDLMWKGNINKVLVAVPGARWKSALKHSRLIFKRFSTEQTRLISWLK